MRPWSYELAGRFDEHVLTSEALRGNPLGDPHERPLWVYLPPGYDTEPDRRYPSVYVIQGYTGQLDMWRNRSPFGAKTYPELADELFAAGDAPPAIVAWVDAWTALGGSQILDSPAIGRYHSYLCDDVVPWVDRNYRTIADPRHRGIQGKSSGGYGAMVTPLLRPDLFGALATHAGDALFENCYAKDFPETVRVLRDRYEGSFERFWADFRSRPGIDRPGDHVLVNTWGMAAAYSADEDGTVRLPFDVDTGEVIPEIWERWLAWDPVRMVERYSAAARSLHAVYIDSGTSDEFYLDLGAEGFRRALAEIGVTDVFFELFEGKHGGIVWRYPIALRYLAERLAP
ncbi:MAG: alpha/beta hydrolase-fold protein [Actinomycetota bacterium]|nr:alpha/beta hydrolase-fold protein [Actinomycetota bacterium]